LISKSLFFIALITLISNNSLSAEEKPQRIVSLSLCTDQVLLMLVEPDRIASVSHLAADPVYSYMAAYAEGIQVHNGLAEEIIPLNPDVIIASKYTTGNTVEMLKQLGHTVITFPSPTTLAEVEIFTRDIGQAVGEPEKANSLIQTMHQEIQAAQALVKHLPKEKAISYAPNGFTAGTYTLKTEILKKAGYSNLSSELGIDYYGNISIESLIINKPDVVIIDEDLPNQDSLAQRFTNHPALQRMLGEKGPTRMPTNHWLCPGPLASKAIMKLAESRQ